MRLLFSVEFSILLCLLNLFLGFDSSIAYILKLYYTFYFWDSGGAAWTLDP